MGQSSSTQRDHRRSLSDHLLFRTARGWEHRHEAMSDRRHFEQTGDAGHPSRTEIFNDNMQTAPSVQPGTAAELSGQSTFSDSWRTNHLGNTRGENGSVFDLGHQQDYQDYRSATFARMTARRQSTMSRLGSRILPNSVIRGLLSSEEETPAEGHAHRHGVSRSTPRSEVAHNSSRFSPFNSLGSRGITRRSLRAPYFIPRSDPTLAPDTSTPSAYPDPASERARESNRGSWRRSARLHRVRRSLSNPLSQMLGQPSTGISSPNTEGEGAVRPSSPGDGPYPLFPPSTELDSRMDFDEPHGAHELDSVEPAVRHTRPDSPASNQSAQEVTNTRQIPSFLRAQPSRVLRREEQMPMSRVLQLAAAAIAAQLSGSTSPVLPNIQALGNDGLNGSLENFIQSLHNATSTQANPSDAPNPAGEGGPSPPLNFLRVFRFANSDPARADATNRTSTGSDNVNNQADGMDVDNQPEGTEAEGRTVTLVVVGVRLVPASNGPGNDQPNPGHDLDALLRMPFLSPGIRNPDGGSNRPDAASRLFPSRLSRESGALSTNDDTMQQGSSNVPHRLSDASIGSPLSSLPNSSPASPSGPHPPPSTPAEPGLSTSASGASTPSRRPSSTSAMSPNALPQVHENQSIQPSVEHAEEHAPLNTARQRRRSDSEYARHRGLGAGSNRRNGVVEPDNATPPVGRSWLIYVVGANVSENNLAFATPSLFTDNPTYEDMILLSSLLGPAKPPVATQEDVSSAGGLFRLVEYAGSLVAEAADGAGNIQIPEGDRCLICLSDYEAAEELRQLTKCQHVFHRDCIDQWLTTGRNSCPLCRGEGVTETQNTNPAQGPAMSGEI
ncbi:RING-H2 finger protein [Aspergillus chevalieri]|uniref:RING-type domain-containing protein n=1 Tax=Aspergillus chevalieri TaxID=182096 RepID=A0A7R7VNT7_ASPCH|nr:uncharacterized protein ACHE_40595A [Aspergillus chevalieri]BCR88031.1 hypothetical protein ACHE_40595A [Aspergillus chevalieri]